jgi:hypothetical protein
MVPFFLAVLLQLCLAAADAPPASLQCPDAAGLRPMVIDVLLPAYVLDPKRKMTHAFYVFNLHDLIMQQTGLEPPEEVFAVRIEPIVERPSLLHHLHILSVPETPSPRPKRAFFSWFGGEYRYFWCASSPPLPCCRARSEPSCR